MSEEDIFNTPFNVGVWEGYYKKLGEGFIKLIEEFIKSKILDHKEVIDYSILEGEEFFRPIIERIIERRIWEKGKRGRELYKLIETFIKGLRKQKNVVIQK